MPKARNHWIGFDLGGTKMLAAVYTNDFQEIGRKKRRTKGVEGVSACLDRIYATIKDAIRAAKVSAADIAGIGIGCPGPVDPSTGMVLSLTNLGWKDVPLTTLVGKKFGCPTLIANDVDFGTFGEYTFGAGRKTQALLGLFPGTGIGGGFVHQGKIFTGRTVSCLEVGHICVQPDGALCGCGRRGCLETIAGRLAIASAAAAAVYRGEAPALQAIAGTDIAAIRSSSLAQSIDKGDRAVQAIVEHAARYLGAGIGSLVNILAPDRVVLGGGMIESLSHIMLKPIRKQAAASVMPVFQGHFEIVTAELGDDAVLKGAAAWARQAVTGGAV